MRKRKYNRNSFQEEAYIAKKGKKGINLINLPLKNIQYDTGHHILPTQLKCILAFLLISSPPGGKGKKNYWI